MLQTTPKSMVNVLVKGTNVENTAATSPVALKNWISTNFQSKAKEVLILLKMKTAHKGHNTFGSTLYK